MDDLFHPFFQRLIKLLGCCIVFLDLLEGLNSTEVSAQSVLSGQWNTDHSTLELPLDRFIDFCVFQKDSKQNIWYLFIDGDLRIRSKLDVLPGIRSVQIKPISVQPRPIVLIEIQLEPGLFLNTERNSQKWIGHVQSFARLQQLDTQNLIQLQNSIEIFKPQTVYQIRFPNDSFDHCIILTKNFKFFKKESCFNGWSTFLPSSHGFAVRLERLCKIQKMPTFVKIYPQDLSLTTRIHNRTFQTNPISMTESVFKQTSLQLQGVLNLLAQGMSIEADAQLQVLCKHGSIRNCFMGRVCQILCDLIHGNFKKAYTQISILPETPEVQFLKALVLLHDNRPCSIPFGQIADCFYGYPKSLQNRLLPRIWWASVFSKRTGWLETFLKPSFSPKFLHEKNLFEFYQGILLILKGETQKADFYFKRLSEPYTLRTKNIPLFVENWARIYHACIQKQSSVFLMNLFKHLEPFQILDRPFLQILFDYLLEKTSSEFGIKILEELWNLAPRSNQSAIRFQQQCLWIHSFQSEKSLIHKNGFLQDLEEKIRIYTGYQKYIQPPQLVIPALNRLFQDGLQVGVVDRIVPIILDFWKHNPVLESRDVHLMQLAQSLLEHKKPQNVLNVLKLISIPSTDQTVRELRGLANWMLENDISAEQDLRSLQTPKSLEALTQLYTQHNQWLQALESALKYLALLPDSSTLFEQKQKANHILLVMALAKLTHRADVLKKIQTRYPQLLKKYSLQEELLKIFLRSDLNSTSSMDEILDHLSDVDKLKNLMCWFREK
jgi:hypothetical protein